MFQETAQVLCQCTRVAVALIRPLFQALAADRFEVARDAGVEDARGDWVGGGDLVQGGGEGFGGEGRAASEEVVKDGAEGIDVAGRAGGLAGGLFGRDLIRRAEDLAGEGEVGIGLEVAGEAEVGDARFEERVDQDVRGFEVAVNDALLVRVMDGFGDFFD